MPTNLGWGLIPTFGEPSALSFSVELNECELNIIWQLGKEGAKSIYQLAKVTYYLPKTVDRTIGPDLRKWHARASRKGGIKYHYPFIHKSITELEEKGLVETARDTSGVRVKKNVQLSFSGLMVYLRHSTDKNKYAKALRHYPHILPFHEHWQTLQAKFKDQPYRAFAEAVRDCACLQQALFKILPIKLEFKGFVEGDTMLSLIERKPDHERKWHKEIEEFLNTDEAKILLDSHVSFLTLREIRERKSSGRLVDLLLILHRKREFMDIAKKNLHFGSTKQRLKEFFSKYAQLEYFFTGMFVEHLLWEPQPRIQKEKVPVHSDFEVQILQDR